MIDFYDVAFDGFKSEKIKEISSDNQTWMYKEASEFIGLVGFTIFFIAFAGFLSDLKIFKKLKLMLVFLFQSKTQV